MMISNRSNQTKVGRAVVRAARGDVAVFEELEPRQVLSYALAEWYPLIGGQNWHYAGAINAGAATATMTSTAGVMVGTQTTTRLDMHLSAAEDSTDSRFLKMSATGLRLIRRDLNDSAGYQRVTYSAGGVLLLPPVINAGDYYTHTGSSTATSSAGPFTTSMTGSMTVYGEETLVLPAGTFRALRVRRTESTHAVGTGWTSNTSVTETQWIVRGLGMVKLDYYEVQQYSDGERDTTSVQLGLTSASLLGNLLGMRVDGKGQWIQNHDSTVTTADGTNYGGIDVNGATKTRVFTIYNNSKTPLAIGSVQITGANASEFTLVRVPATLLMPGQATPLSVRFDPTTTGFRYAKISIPSSDPSANPYTFDIRGTGLVFGVINVRRIDKATPIVAGSTSPTLDAGTSLGRTTLAGNAYIDRTFIITNTGPGNLILTGMSRVIVSPGVVMTSRFVTPIFEVLSQPAGTIAPGASSTFTIRFNPADLGAAFGTVVIASNDRLTPDFRFVIVGTGK